LAETQSIDSDVKNIVNTILDHENIPRKKPKFTNFVKNIMRNRAQMHAIDKTWDLFSQALKPPAKEMPQENDEKVEEVIVEDKSEEAEEKQKKSKKDKKENKKNKGESVNGDIEMADVDITKKKSKKDRKKEKLQMQEEENVSEETSEKENTEKVSKKKNKKEKNKDKEKIEDKVVDENKNNKRKRDEEMDVDEDESSPKKTKFDWDEVITGLLMKKEDNEMKLNKLKKKCVNEFFSFYEGTHKTHEEVGAKFDKKLKKRKYRVLKDRVKLILDDKNDAEEKSSSSVVTAEPVIKEISKPALSFNQWESSNLGSSAQTEKFRRLMGIKSAPPPQQVQSGKFGVGQRDDRKIFRDLEQGFEKARQAHFGGRCFDQ